MATLIYDPPQPQTDDNALVIAHKTSVNISRIADAIMAGVGTGIVYDPPQPQDDDSEFVLQHKMAANISRIADTL